MLGILIESRSSTFGWLPNAINGVFSWKTCEISEAILLEWDEDRQRKEVLRSPFPSDNFSCLQLPQLELVVDVVVGIPLNGAVIVGQTSDGRIWFGPAVAGH